MAECLYSQTVRAKDRRYFFDVYAHGESLRLSIKESRITGGKQYTQRLQIWESDVIAFFVAFCRSVSMFDAPELLKHVEFLKENQKASG